MMQLTEKIEIYSKKSLTNDVRLFDCNIHFKSVLNTVKLFAFFMPTPYFDL